MLSEFDVIARYFTRPPRQTGCVALGIGDDCALLSPAPGFQLAISTDMLVEGRHFFAGTDPGKLGHKSLAVNLSDLASMAARPIAFTLALALPDTNPGWLQAFSDGMLALAETYDCELIGGDTTKGPLNICITVFGELPPGQALQRDRAQTGDDIWVSGSLGDARLALAAMRGEIALASDALRCAAERLERPMPRVALGLALRGIARAAIDISDGLFGDLGHILERSNQGARLDVDALPIGPLLSRQPRDVRRAFALAGGDDYELCFTAAPAERAAVLAAAASAGIEVARVGTIDSQPGLRTVDADGAPLLMNAVSFDHFLST